MPISEAKMRIVIENYYKSECDMNTSIRSAFEKGFRLGVKKGQSVNTEPVKHGKWIDIDEQTYTWKIRCSCCSYERSMMSTQGKYPNYCEECGARMDEK